MSRIPGITAHLAKDPGLTHAARSRSQRIGAVRLEIATEAKQLLVGHQSCNSVGLHRIELQEVRGTAPLEKDRSVDDVALTGERETMINEGEIVSGSVEQHVVA